MRDKNRVYVASSWRNDLQPWLVQKLRDNGFEVYDFRNPVEGNDGFRWSEIGLASEDCTNTEFIEALSTPTADAGFKLDFDAMKWADIVVLVLPCGRSAHLELGWAAGAGKITAVLLAEHETVPELMYKMVDCISPDPTSLLDWLRTEVWCTAEAWTEATNPNQE